MSGRFSSFLGHMNKRRIFRITPEQVVGGKRVVSPSKSRKIMESHPPRLSGFTWHINGKWIMWRLRRKENERMRERERRCECFFASAYLDHLCTLPTKHQSSVENALSLSRELNMSWFGTQLPPELWVHWGQTIYLKSCQSIQEPCWTYPIPMLSANRKILLHIPC